MKYCPQCGAEYHQKIGVCADCDVELISQQEFEKHREEEERFHEETKTMVKVFTVKDSFEADVITRELEKEGIPVLIRSFKDTAYDGIYIPQKGWGEVRVPGKDQERARALIDSLEEVLEGGKVSISDEETTTSCPSCGMDLSLEDEVCPHCKKVLGPDGEKEDAE